MTLTLQDPSDCQKVSESFLGLKAVPVPFVLAEKVREAITEKVTRVNFIEIFPESLSSSFLLSYSWCCSGPIPKSLEKHLKNIFYWLYLIFSFVICLHLVQTSCHCIGNFARQVGQYCDSRWWEKEGCLVLSLYRMRGKVRGGGIHARSLLLSYLYIITVLAVQCESPI